jgi:hypothetical protein
MGECMSEEREWVRGALRERDYLSKIFFILPKMGERSFEGEGLPK